MSEEKLIAEGKEQYGVCEVNSSRAFEAGVRHALAAMFPSSYVPREEVREGWYSALRPVVPGERQMIRVYDAHSKVRAVGYSESLDRADFTDFLRVPEWLIHGL